MSQPHQSPIAVTTDICEECEFEPLCFNNYGKKYKMEMTNLGHTVQVTIDKAAKDLPKVAGAKLPGTFVFHNIHFHWKSEHTVNGKRYPLEAHLVHFNEKYKTLEDAVGKDDGLAVLAVMYIIGVQCGCKTVFSKLLDVIDRVSKKIKSPVQLPTEISLQQFLPRNTDDIYAYAGSLTTPGYNEQVNWTVFGSTSIITSRQYDKLTTNLYNEENEPVTSNCRSLQDLNDRTVYRRK